MAFTGLTLAHLDAAHKWVNKSKKPTKSKADSVAKKTANIETPATEDAAKVEVTGGRITRSTTAKRSEKIKAVALNEEASGIEEVNAPKFKEDINAFNVPVEDGKDYISSIPSEMLDRILGYCVMDHEPELAVRQRDQGSNFATRSHVLLSLAAMSKHFRAHAESFCRVEMMRNRGLYRYFKTTAEIEQSAGLRRSPRIKAQPAVEHRCYRIELVKFLETFCIECSCLTGHHATMANAVKCHIQCEPKFFPGVIDLTTALRRYDLRDWMLIKTRKPSPRARKTDLPSIHYGTVRTGTPFWTGMMISYRFFEKHVESLAKSVHGDLEGHMAEKRKQQADRTAKKRRDVHRGLKVRYHAEMLEVFTLDDPDEELRQLHQDRLTHYTSPDYDADAESDIDMDFPEDHYGPWEDVHSKLCEEKRDCQICWENSMRKYHDWFW